MNGLQILLSLNEIFRERLPYESLLWHILIPQSLFVLPEHFIYVFFKYPLTVAKVSFKSYLWLKGVI